MGAKTIKGITVEINGKTTGLGKVLDAAKKQAMGVNKELKTLNKGLKFNPSSTVLLAEKQKVLADAVKAAREELKTLEDTQKQVTAQYEAGEIDRGAYIEFQEKLEAARANLKRLEEAQRDFGNVASQVMQQAGEKVEEFGGKVEGAGKKLMPLSAGTAAAGAAGVKMAWNFEDAMAKVSTIADETQVPIAELEAQILQLSDETGIAAGELAENVYNAISAGQSTGDAVSFVKNATDLARAGFADSGDALNILTTIMNAYGLEASEVTNVSDILIATQNEGKTTVAELASSMGKVIPTANASGVALDQLATGYAIMTKNGVATAESTTYMNGMLNELSKSGTKVSDVLVKETGKGFSDLMAEGMSLGDVLGILSDSAADNGLKLNDLFGSSEAAKAALILLGNSAEDVENGFVEAGGSTSQFNEMLTSIQGATGGTADALGKLDTNNHKAVVAFNQVKNSALQFGQTASGMLAPYIENLAGKIQSATQYINNMDEGQKKTIVTIAGVVAAAGPVLMIVGKITSGVGKVISVGGKMVGLCSTVAGAFKTGGAAAKVLSGGVKVLSGAFSFLAANPIVAVIAVVAGLAAGFVALYNKCEWFRNGVNSVVDSIKEKFSMLADGFKQAGETIKNGWNSAVTKVKEAGEKCSEAWTNTKEKCSETWEGIKTKCKESGDKIKSSWDTSMTKVKEATGKCLDAAKVTTQEKLDNIKSAYEQNGGGIRGISAAAMEGIKSVHTFGLTFIDNLTGGKLSNVANTFSTKLSNARTTTSNMMDNIKGAFSEKMESARSAVSEKLGSISSSFSTKLNEAKSTVSTIMDNIKGAFSEKIEAARSVVSQGIEKIKGCFNFSWKLPDLKLPHISVSGGVSPYGIGGKGSLPKFHIDWYKDGGILSGAQIFGSMGKRLLGGGEAGPEAVLPLRSFYDELARILDKRLAGFERTQQFNQYNTYNSPRDLSPAECARQTRNETRKLLAAVKKA